MRSVVEMMKELNVPDIPFNFPIEVSWIFMLEKSHTYKYKSTQPDVDGYVKTTKDCLQEKKLFKTGKASSYVGAGIITNDSLVVKETSIKTYGPTNGIFIQIDRAKESPDIPEWIDSICKECSRN